MGELQAILDDAALVKPLTKKTHRLLRAQLKVKTQEEKETEEGSETLIKQVGLFNAYQQQLIEKTERVGRGDFSGPLKLQGRDELAFRPLLAR